MGWFIDGYDGEAVNSGSKTIQGNGQPCPWMLFRTGFYEKPKC